MEGTEQSKGLVSAAPRIVTTAIDRRFERVADFAWLKLKHRPYLGVTVAVGVTLGAASLVGIPELLLAAGAGYAAYQVLKLNVPPSEAIRKVAKVEEGLV